MGAVHGSEISGARNNESGFVGITYLYEHMLAIGILQYADTQWL